MDLSPFNHEYVHARHAHEPESRPLLTHDRVKALLCKIIIATHAIADSPETNIANLHPGLKGTLEAVISPYGPPWGVVLLPIVDCKHPDLRTANANRFTSLSVTTWLILEEVWAKSLRRELIASRWDSFGQCLLRMVLATTLEAEHEILSGSSTSHSQSFHWRKCQWCYSEDHCYHIHLRFRTLLSQEWK